MQTQAQSGAYIGSCSDDDVCIPMTCTLCMAEIPPSAALTFEGADYATHFCGLECMESWKREKLEEESP